MLEIEVAIIQWGVVRMSIKDKDKIDSIGMNKETGIVTLAITDHLDWSNEYEHLILLQDKINIYVSFLESGEVYESYPQAEGKNFEIKIFSKFDLPGNAVEYLNVAYSTVKEAGFDLSYEVSEE
ncbi:DUF6572 domain-containing protein [Falsibacillus albus]|uniref:Uncharacterized protein n=1 Tax=Falsibacillus albus TaxID=2478915 RepID=A0A3L7JTT3_9BACI|nr:DUF6572 domain-containing protein [Falsibacillus albus]RLQ93674.1 hypothetical protein D9X91_16975 [Falsibacillus albus]